MAKNKNHLNEVMEQMAVDPKKMFAKTGVAVLNS